MDITLLDFINSNRTPFADSLFGIVTETAGPFAWGIPILLFIIALIYKNKTLRNKAITLFLMVVIAAIFSNILKYSIDRTRPFKEYDFIEKLSSGGSPSFPSGHTTDAFVLATGLFLLFFRRSPYAFIAYLWAIMVGYSRMYLGVHYPSDVLAGVVLGLFSAYLVLLISKKSGKILSI
ncbi:putative undecaprenyl-diphosphatase YbjG [bioreactor metagenome]|jgi:undecaprenyl-diphosphatase|uniref:Putative undecaprenyl-diphosphatase YbjG n=1 Tax=bioreactor metagenome TaxID=1076179 RepID=A0A644YE64_9ZZZZ